MYTITNVNMTYNVLFFWAGDTSILLILCIQIF